jgi:hypothetical protein
MKINPAAIKIVTAYATHTFRGKEIVCNIVMPSGASERVHFFISDADYTEITKNMVV